MTPHERMVIEREKRRQEAIKKAMLPKKGATSLTYTTETWDALMQELEEARR